MFKFCVYARGSFLRKKLSSRSIDLGLCEGNFFEEKASPRALLIWDCARGTFLRKKFPLALPSKTLKMFLRLNFIVF